MFVVDIIFPSLLLVCSVDRSQEFHGGEMGNAELVEHLERQFAALGASGAHGRSARKVQGFSWLRQCVAQLTVILRCFVEYAHLIEVVCPAEPSAAAPPC